MENFLKTKKIIKKTFMNLIKKQNIYNTQKTKNHEQIKLNLNYPIFGFPPKSKNLSISFSYY